MLHHTIYDYWGAELFFWDPKLQGQEISFDNGPE